jgi:hypothetical protein
MGAAAADDGVVVDLGITSAYLRGIDNTEMIQAVHE